MEIPFVKKKDVDWPSMSERLEKMAILAGQIESRELRDLIDLTRLQYASGDFLSPKLHHKERIALICLTLMIEIRRTYESELKKFNL